MARGKKDNGAPVGTLRTQGDRQAPFSPPNGLAVALPLQSLDGHSPVSTRCDDGSRVLKMPVGGLRKAEPLVWTEWRDHAGLE